MTGLLVLVVVLLIIIIVWMIAITLLYMSLAKSMQRFAEVDAIAISKLFERQEGIVGICQRILDNFQLLDEVVDKYKADIDTLIGESSKDKKFAIETIQQARRLQNQLEAKLNPETFVYTEPEEDPEDPRS